MTEQGQTTAVGALPTPDSTESRGAAVLTTVVWGLWILSCGAFALHVLRGDGWSVGEFVAIDGLTVVMWVAVTFFSGIVHSYSRRYLAGSRTIDAFFRRVFAFTLVVMILVAADNLLLFGVAWLAMGLVMADLIGHVEEWQQARAAAVVARRYFLASSAALGVALATLWIETGSASISSIVVAIDQPSLLVLVAAAALLLAAMIQSALLPFHSWLLSSMTAPTPASALMHAGFVNAGGVLLVRFAPVVSVDAGILLLITLVGAVSAIGGKLMKTVRPDIKGKLGCSTVGQMGLMIMQAGLGFFAAAITHLILHGFFKAYQFLAAGSNVEHKSPTKSTPNGNAGALGIVVMAATALAGGALFATLTGKGTELSSGLILVLLVVLTVLHAVREFVRDASVPTLVRYGAVPVVALPAIATYAAVYRVIESALYGLPAIGQPAELTPIHVLIAVGFVVTYLAIESGLYQQSTRLYAALVNAAQPASETLLTTTEDYNEY